MPYAASVRAMLSGAPRRRRDQVAIIAVARRTWRDGLDPAAQAELVYALGHFSQYRALLLMLDRIDVKSPAVWARSIDAAKRVDSGGNRERELKIGAFQGALALIERASLVGSLNAAGTEKALLTLATAVDTEAPVPVSVRTWLLETFIPSLPPLVRPDRFSQRSAYESRVLQALAGAPATTDHPFSWEGLDYTVDPMAGEHERIIRIREQLPTPGLDAALESKDPEALVTALRAIVVRAGAGRSRRSGNAQPGCRHASRLRRDPIAIGSQPRLAPGHRAHGNRRALARRRQPARPGPRARPLGLAAPVGGRDARRADDQPERPADAGAHGRGPRDLSLRRCDARRAGGGDRARQAPSRRCRHQRAGPPRPWRGGGHDHGRHGRLCRGPWRRCRRPARCSSACGT